MFDKINFKIPLDKFIENALYHPKKGYYSTKNPFGKEGDFITAPNISKVFSEMIFIWIISYWQKFYKNKEINIIELGAGNGEMIKQIIISSKKFNNFHKNCNFKIFEKSEKLIKLQKSRLKKYNIKWLKNFDKLDNKPVIFLGNEFLDALPIKQYIKNNGSWYERYVKKHGKFFKFKNIKCDIKKIEKKLNLNLSNKHKFLEVPFEAIKILKKLDFIITKKRGCLLFIDYAYTKCEMIDTLQAVKKHKKVNLFDDVGNADISHIINIPFLKEIVKKLNLRLKYTTQRNFLLNLGIMKRAELLSSNKNFLEKANIFYRITRLIDKKQMGELFKVIYIYKKNNKFNLGFK